VVTLLEDSAPGAAGHRTGSPIAFRDLTESTVDMITSWRVGWSAEEVLHKWLSLPA